jgi:hypothetical protein
MTVSEKRKREEKEKEIKSPIPTPIYVEEKCYLQKTSKKADPDISFPAVVCTRPHHLEYCTCKHIYS